MTRHFAAAMAMVCCAALPWPAMAQAPDPHAHHTPPPDAKSQAAEPLPGNVPPLTDADRAAAFPDVAGHAANDNSLNYRVLFDRFEWQRASGANSYHWDNKGWIGKDTNRLWFRTEAEAEGRAISKAQADVLVGHSIARWWDIVAGVRQDIRPGAPQTWAAIGVQGLAPYWFEIEATAYVGAGGRTRARLEVEYELLITNRLVLQPLVEFELSGKSDPERGISAGAGTVETGLRFRYELRREAAPYAGLTWQHNVGNAGELGEGVGMKFVAGVRWWF